VKIDHNDPRPPFRQIADDLRKQIESGKPGPGEKLDSIKQLADKYGVAGQTIQSAVRVLRNDGLVVSQHGRGLFVRDPGRPVAGTDSDRLAAAEAELRELRERIAAAEADIAELRASGRRS
jgi:GntR family transcriptional regulator